MSIRNCDRMLKRAYGELRPEDLAHLTLRALARDDIAEADRIAGTVPLVTYRGPDLDYVRLLEEAK